MDEALIVAGVGCRRGASAAAIRAAIDAALARARLGSDVLGAIAIPEKKRQEPGVVAAARALRVPLVLVSQRELEAAGHRAVTRSARVMALMGVPSVAEAAALAAGGANARLLAPRIAIGPATCAIAETGDRP